MLKKIVILSAILISINYVKADPPICNPEGTICEICNEHGCELIML